MTEQVVVRRGVGGVGGMFGVGRARLWVLVCLAVVVLVIVGMGPGEAVAQNLYMLEGTEAEKEALASLDAGKMIGAREKAQKVLEGGESLIGTFVMASVYYDEEANYPRALFLLRKAKKMLTDEFGERPEMELAQQWHKRMLRLEIWILSEMDRREEELDVLVYYDQLYKPPLEEDRIWALVKLNRYEEAEAIGRKLIVSDDFGIRRQAYNGLIAMANEKRDRVGALAWGMEGMEKTQERSCVIASNTALAAVQNLKFSEVESLVKKAKKAEYQDCSGSPYAQLAGLYLMTGEFQKTISTLEQLRREPSDARLRSQFEMYYRSITASLLYALGQIKQAEERMKTVIETPDRVGMQSSSLENMKLGYTLIYWAILTAKWHQLSEQIAARDFADWGTFALIKDREMLALTLWERKRMAINLASEQNLIVTLARPYFTEVAPWYAGVATELFGPGLVRQAVEEARIAEGEAKFKEAAMEGYFEAMLAEAAWREDAYGEAGERIQKALGLLPPEERLLMWRLKAIQFAVWREGGSGGGDQGAVLHELMQQYPTVFRHLGLSIPVEIVHEGGAEAEVIAGLLQKSPRFELDDAGLRLRVVEQSEGISMCLNSRGGQQYTCYQSWEKLEDTLTEEIPTDDADRRAWMIGRFLDRAFSPKVELTQSDINTLDGRTGRINADDAIKGILGGP